MRRSTPEEVRLLVEAAANTAAARVPLFKNEYKKLKRNAAALSRISRHRRVTEAKKDLVQYGAGVLPILLPAVVSLLTSLIANSERA